MRYLSILILFLCGNLYSGEMKDLEYDGKAEEKYPYGKFVVYNEKLLTFLDSNLVIINNEKVEIIKTNIKEFNRFEYASPEKIFLLIDTAIIEFDGSEWTKPSNMVYNIDNFKLEPFEYRTLTYDQLNDRLNIISPNFYYLYYQKDTLNVYHIENNAQKEMVGYFSFYSAAVYNGSCYFLNFAATLSKLEFPDIITYYQKDEYMDLSRDLYPGNSITGAFRNLGDRLWLGTGDGLLTFYDGTNFPKIDIMSNLNKDDIYEDYYHIRDFNIDRDGNYWLAVEWISNNVWGDKSHQTIYKFHKADNFKSYEFWQRTGFDKKDSDEFNYFKIELDKYDQMNKKVYIKSQDGFMVYDPDATSVTDDFNNDITISPNPVQNELMIENYEIGINENFEIYNVLSEKVLTKSISENNTINVSHLTPGVYFIKIGDQMQKFVKE